MSLTATNDSGSLSAQSVSGSELRAVRGTSTDVEPTPDPRFTFANERTFLAWTRTSLALIGAGLAVAQLLKLRARVAPLLSGVGLIALGSPTSLTSDRQYRRNQQPIQHGQPVPPGAMPHILTCGAALFAVLATVLEVLAFVHR